MEGLIKKLSAFGNIEAIKDDAVFTLLITKTNRNISVLIFDIMKTVLESTDKKIVELLKNDDNYALIVLK